MPRASQENKIIEAALDCFAELGYDGTRIRHIADKAEVAESALYRHFASKEDIARTIYHNCLHNIQDRFLEIQVSPSTAETKIKQFVELALDFYRNRPTEFSYTMIQTPNFELCLPVNFVSPLDIISKVIIEGQQQGCIRAGNPAILAASFIGSILKPIALAQMSIIPEIDSTLIRDNESLLIELGWAMLANPINTPI